MSFYQSNRYFSIFGLHYLVGYGGGAPALEAWAVAHPLRVISQVYVDSPGLSADYLNSYAAREFGGETDAGYTTVVFPKGFDLIRYDETVLPTWYIHPDQRSIDASLVLLEAGQRHRRRRPARRRRSAPCIRQRRGSDRWMTSYAGPIAQVAVQDRPIGNCEQARAPARSWIPDLLHPVRELLRLRQPAFRTRRLRQARRRGPDDDGRRLHPRVPRLRSPVRPPALAVPGAGRVRVARQQPDRQGVLRRRPMVEGRGTRGRSSLVTICEQYSSTSISVSHRDSNTFYLQLRDTMIDEYPVDPTRFYSTGQSAGSSGDAELRDRVPGVLRRGRLDLLHRRPERRPARSAWTASSTRPAAG